MSPFLKSAIRNIRKYSAHSILNISGMAIGMAAGILILLWVWDEWSYDRQFNDADNLYRILEKNDALGIKMAPTARALSKVLKQEYPEIVRSTTYGTPPEFSLQKGETFINEKVGIIDKDFLRMFDIDFIKGDINTALNDPRNIIITKKMADKYFGDVDPLGKTLTAVGGQIVFTVTGVVRDMPPNSHISFEFLFPTEWNRQPNAADEWNWRDYNYLELKPGTDAKLFGEKIKDVLKTYKQDSSSVILLQNIKKIHLYSSGKYSYDMSGLGDISYVRIMSLIAVFILIIACVNFMNLATAQSAKRAKEIGILKVTGAGRRRIIMQFLGESLLVVLIAHILAMILVELFLPGYSTLTGKQLHVNYQDPFLYIGLITIILFSGLLAGSYPAFYLSSLKPLDTIKGLHTRNQGNPGLRKILVIFQFTLSVLLIICTLVIRSQLHFMQNKNLGFNKDDIGYFNYPAAPWDHILTSVKTELSKDPDLISIAGGPLSPFNIEGMMSNLKWTGKKEGTDIIFYGLFADFDFAPTFKLELKTGRLLSPAFATDSSAVVINEEAEKVLGFDNPIGQSITGENGLKMTIVGVVKDFHFKSLHHKIGPLIMGYGTSNFFYVKMKHDNVAATIKSVQKIYDSFKPVSPLNFHFLNEDFDNMYQVEKRIGKIFSWFSIMAIIISCLGLIGLSSFMTEGRTKEIGVRKINGARSYEVFAMLSTEFLSWVCIAILIACPLAWFIMTKWLSNFAYRIDLSLWFFLLAGAIALLIAFLTVSVQSYLAARKNPVDALRYE